MEVHRGLTRWEMNKGSEGERQTAGPRPLSSEQRRKPQVYEVCAASFQEGAGLGLVIRGLM